ncbi:peptidoglycan editing factor PgeF [Qipengyuania atrilutea]|uniref:Purine nucleoside phosphorylase n=1 Tax=Qipengyuania atrilutea TaxID=2744473 RepID=A0A850HDB4_9SPHN|nr:peptidoglycan editing factor PgeF [Actirhodobacter atriluteus]NVD45149.1 peptidoglycan editing factor PgeF [Actirhodobacter atriluteus]
MTEEPQSSALLGGIPHGFFGSRRPRGGNGPFDARDPAVVKEAAAIVDANSAAMLCDQIHSAVTVTVDAPIGPPWPKADALVTNRPGLALGIYTADCAPVLFADEDAGIVGAAHAGWRGAHGGILDSCVDAMVTLGARREMIHAVIGPCIAQESYEVDEAFRAEFGEEDAAFFVPGRQGHYFFDLVRYVGARLRRAGLFRFAALGLDTRSLSDRYFSFRRATELGEATGRRQISLIAAPSLLTRKPAVA